MLPWFRKISSSGKQLLYYATIFVKKQILRLSPAYSVVVAQLIFRHTVVVRDLQHKIRVLVAVTDHRLTPVVRVRTALKI